MSDGFHSIMKRSFLRGQVRFSDDDPKARIETITLRTTRKPRRRRNPEPSKVSKKEIKEKGKERRKANCHDIAA